MILLGFRPLSWCKEFSVTKPASVRRWLVRVELCRPRSGASGATEWLLLRSETEQLPWQNTPDEQDPLAKRKINCHRTVLRGTRPRRSSDLVSCLIQTEARPVKARHPSH